jgi:biopolymer transport protein ExbB
MDLLHNAGLFIYPLAVCSLLAVFITVERILALRSKRIVPTALLDTIVHSKPLRSLDADPQSALGRIVLFAKQRNEGPTGLLAFARLEVNRMERGLFLLEVVVGAAPLLGLLGTVTGLTQVFGNYSAETGMPDPASFIQGIALALTTTILGLTIAIPSLLAHSWLQRKVEAHAARLHVAVECLTGAIESEPEKPQ